MKSHAWGLEPRRFSPGPQMTFRHYWAIFRMSLIDHYSHSPNFGQILKPPNASSPTPPPLSRKPPTFLQKPRSGGIFFNILVPQLPSFTCLFNAVSGRAPLPYSGRQHLCIGLLSPQKCDSLSPFSWTFPPGHSPPDSNVLKQNKINKENLSPSWARPSSSTLCPHFP